jgi:hypothetical protein
MWVNSTTRNPARGWGAATAGFETVWVSDMGGG